MRKRHMFGMLVLVLCSGFAMAVGDDKPRLLADTTGGGKEADIRRLLELSGAANLGKQVMGQMLGQFRQSMPQVPAEFWDGFQKEVRGEDMVDLIVPIYAKHFSQQDIGELIKFYESPIGRKLVAQQPQIVAESMVAGQAWGKQVAAKVIQRLRDKGYMKAA